MKRTTEPDWEHIDHYFARGPMCWGRGLTVDKAIARARREMPRIVHKGKPVRKTAFDVWHVPAGLPCQIDEMGTVHYADGVKRVLTAKEG